MAKVMVYGLLIVMLVVLPASAIPTTTTYENSLRLHKTLDNYWWTPSVPASASWKIANPYPGTAADYDNALKNNRISNISLTLVTDELDNGRSADIWAMDKKGVWHNKDINGKPMLLKSSDLGGASGLNGLNYGNGQRSGSLSGSGSQMASTSFDIDPSWLNDGYLTVAANLNNYTQGSSQFGIETSKLTVVANDYNPTVPLPGSILLSGIGLAVVGWLRRLRTL